MRVLGEILASGLHRVRDTTYAKFYDFRVMLSCLSSRCLGLLITLTQKSERLHVLSIQKRMPIKFINNYSDCCIQLCLFQPSWSLGILLKQPWSIRVVLEFNPFLKLSINSRCVYHKISAILSSRFASQLNRQLLFI